MAITWPLASGNTGVVGSSDTVTSAIVSTQSVVLFIDKGVQKQRIAINDEAEPEWLTGLGDAGRNADVLALETDYWH